MYLFIAFVEGIEAGSSENGPDLREGADDQHVYRVLGIDYIKKESPHFMGIAERA
jgi:hypothetical protein